MSGDYSYLDSFPRRAEKKMSAVSEPQRRKSANGRMQSSASSVVAADCRESGRGEAAGSSPEGGCGAKKGRSRRVKSARETRLEQESSEIFPPAEPGKGAWGRTQYDDNFGRKQPVTPVPVRPVSPTRRNNPHPAKVSVSPAHFYCTHTRISLSLFSLFCSGSIPSAYTRTRSLSLQQRTPGSISVRVSMTTTLTPETVSLSSWGSN